MTELDEIVKYLQHRLLLNNHLQDKIKASAYAEAIKPINEAFNTDYEIEGLYKLKFENLAALTEFSKTLPLRRRQ
jgi:uncharacterized protein YeeX (DUF496 family)